ncbi:uncharacterized protein LOC125185602 [Salvia hispanica]|uniref:uncharacterized protein LOC125185602 n=1 Tax=Salvia hispanica TaxID=49212 RepID=UPI0020096775|nr:uncharacterized protein LOC125185602 [Salvia hispanica]
MEQLNNIYFILMESVTIIFSWKKIFTQITIATIFPLYLLSLLHELLFSNILHNSFNNSPNKWWFCLFNAAYIVLFLVLSLVSTSGVVEAVALVYTAKEPRFAEVMGVVPRVWKRVTATFLWSLLLVVTYNTAAFAPISPWVSYNLIFYSVYAAGFVYISIIWHLASVVSVLEECGGVDAMIKGLGLVKGRMVISGVVFFLLNLCFVWIEVVFQRYVVVGEMVWRRIGCGIVSLLVLCGITLLGLVTQTVVYFDCKLYHGEINIIPIANSNDARVDLGDYAPFRSNELDRC